MMHQSINAIIQYNMPCNSATPYKSRKLHRIFLISKCACIDITRNLENKKKKKLRRGLQPYSSLSPFFPFII